MRQSHICVIVKSPEWFRWLMSRTYNNLDPTYVSYQTFIKYSFIEQSAFRDTMFSNFRSLAGFWSLLNLEESDRNLVRTLCSCPATVSVIVPACSITSSRGAPGLQMICFCTKGRCTPSLSFMNVMILKLIEMPSIKIELDWTLLEDLV